MIRGGRWFYYNKASHCFIGGLISSCKTVLCSKSLSLLCVNVFFYLKVDQLQVNYSREKVYIYLHPGAIVNGQYVRIPLIKAGRDTGIPKHTSDIDRYDIHSKVIIGIPTISGIPQISDYQLYWTTCVMAMESNTAMLAAAEATALAAAQATTLAATKLACCLSLYQYSGILRYHNQYQYQYQIVYPAQLYL